MRNLEPDAIRGGAQPAAVFTVPRWEVSGVTSVTMDLAGALQERGLRCRILVDEDNRAASPFDVPAGCSAEPLLAGTPWWRLSPSRSWAYRWRLGLARRRLARVLAEERPVAWFPGYSYALLSPAIAGMPGLGIIGVVHSDDESNLGFAREHGRQFARCVCVSEQLTRRVGEVAPWLGPMVKAIPNGVACPATAPHREQVPGRPLRVVYAGRLEQNQKRVHDLPKLVALCAGRGLAIHWEVAGEGPEAGALREALAPEIASGRLTWHGPLKRAQVRRIFEAADATILFSNFEGLPIALLEAMAAGCVPLVSEGCDAGADLVRSSGAGMVVPTGDMEAFAQGLATLCSQLDQRAAMAGKSWEAVAHGPHNLAVVAASYHGLIEECLRSPK